jgi:hypothetical protein
VNTTLTTAIVSACLLAAVWIGMWLRRFLSEDHLSPVSRDTVKLAMGVVATMSALLLGLLVSSAKTSYDTTRAEVMQVASKYRLIDHMLTIYGPQAVEVRDKLHTLIEESMRRMWPDHADLPVPSNHKEFDSFYVALLNLEAHNDTERTLKAQAANLTLEMAQFRSLMMAESTTSISTPLLIVVVLWLVQIFLGFSLIAPPNATANFTLIASAMCSAGAFFLILDLDLPFSGIMRISSEPIWNVLGLLGKLGL